MNNPETQEAPLTVSIYSEPLIELTAQLPPVGSDNIGEWELEKIREQL